MYVMCRWSWAGGRSADAEPKEVASGWWQQQVGGGPGSGSGSGSGSSSSSSNKVRASFLLCCALALETRLTVNRIAQGEY